MDMKKEQLKKRIKVTNKEEKADLVIKNGKIVNVFTSEYMTGDIAIVDGVIAGIGIYEGKEELDAAGKIIVPGLIDAHVHIESSMVTPREFSKVLLPHGVTTVITDPHEIANVAGEEGISFMLEDSEKMDLNVYLMLPSSVPATPFENSGAILENEQLLPFYEQKRVLGLAEVMDYPSVRNAERKILDKLVTASAYHIDGHGSGLDEHGVNIYAAAGIQTDHECTTLEQAKDRLSKGMYLMIREGSVAKNLSALLPVVTERNSHRCMFCTDDKHLDDLIEEGSIDHIIRLAIKQGLDPLLAVQLGTINAAKCFGLKNKGAIAPGYAADILILNDLEFFEIEKVYTNGQLVSEKGQYVGEEKKHSQNNKELIHSVNLPILTKDDLEISLLENKEVPVIEIIPNQIETIKRMEKVSTESGKFVASTSKDLLKIAVIERHKRTGNIGLGIVKGLGLSEGAIATTVAHDSHNVICAGTSDEDMLIAIHQVKNIQGGMVVVQNGQVTAELSLEIGGLMSERGYHEVVEMLQQLHEALSEISKYSHFNQFLTLSFLSLPVIPELKITDKGLFDVTMFKHITL